MFPSRRPHHMYHGSMPMSSLSSPRARRAPSACCARRPSELRAGDALARAACRHKRAPSAPLTLTAAPGVNIVGSGRDIAEQQPKDHGDHRKAHRPPELTAAARAAAAMEPLLKPSRPRRRRCERQAPRALPSSGSKQQ
eukprot:6121521-Prymnesium_polylepis.2